MKTSVKAVSSLTLAVALFAPPAIAHHGKDFFTVASSRLPHRNQWFTVLSVDYTKSLSAFSLEPGLLYGVTQYWSAEAHVHLEQSSHSLGLESIGIEQRFLLWDWAEIGAAATQRTRTALGLLFEVEKGLIHHAEDEIELRGILSHTRGDFELSLNLIGQQTLRRHHSLDLAYAAGLRLRILGILSSGIEVRGNLRKVGETIVTPGIFAEISPQLNVHLGSSIDLKPGGNGTVVRASLLYEL